MPTPSKVCGDKHSCVIMSAGVISLKLFDSLNDEFLVHGHRHPYSGGSHATKLPVLVCRPVLLARPVPSTQQHFEWEINRRAR